jgi:hypothetical protein
LPPFFAIAKHLGYPDYFPMILGVWYVLAPRFPRLKEAEIRPPSCFNGDGLRVEQCVSSPTCYAGF